MPSQEPAFDSVDFDSIDSIQRSPDYPSAQAAANFQNCSYSTVARPVRSPVLAPEVPFALARPVDGEDYSHPGQKVDFPAVVHRNVAVDLVLVDDSPVRRAGNYRMDVVDLIPSVAAGLVGVGHAGDRNPFAVGSFGSVGRERSRYSNWMEDRRV